MSGYWSHEECCWRQRTPSSLRTPWSDADLAHVAPVPCSAADVLRGTVPAVAVPVVVPVVPEPREDAGLPAAV